MTVRGGVARAYTPAKTRSFETMVAEEARLAVGAMEPYAGPVEIEAHFMLPIPKSWPKRDRNMALDGKLLPTGRPDLDNFTKALTDALNGIVYTDDSLIVTATLRKIYSAEPGVIVTARAA